MTSENSRDTCLLCGRIGDVLYENLQDMVVGAAGRWRIRRCEDKSNCGLAWLDPLPTEEQLALAYSNGYHANHLQARHNVVKKALIRATYGLLERFTPLESSAPIEEMFLGNVRPGRLLDVGCGPGIFLRKMRTLGWSVEGLDRYAEAAKVANETSAIPVRVGTIEDAGYTSGSFDAVTLSHVIEHVADPTAVLRQCWHLVNAGGSITVITPNIESLAHSHFGNHWPGLGPPRHLQLFSIASLRKCAVDAGILTPRVWTSAGRATGLYLGSLRLRRIAGRAPLHNSILDYARALMFALTESRRLVSHPEVGEELVLQAFKTRNS